MYLRSQSFMLMTLLVTVIVHYSHICYQRCDLHFNQAQIWLTVRKVILKIHKNTIFFRGLICTWANKTKSTMAVFQWSALNMPTTPTHCCILLYEMWENVQNYDDAKCNHFSTNKTCDQVSFVYKFDYLVWCGNHSSFTHS